MIDKEELVIGVAKTLFDIAKASGKDWDEVYLRFHSQDPSHRSVELLYRKNRRLDGLSGEDRYLDLLGTLLMGLFDTLWQEKGKRPLVVVVALDNQRNYNLKFDYDNAGAYEIDLLNLGMPGSYFVNNEIDIPEHVQEYQKELGKKGVHEMPIPFVGRHDPDA